MSIRLGPELRARERGVSLAEILVASTLFLLLMSVLFQLLSTSWRVTAQGAARAELEQLSLVWGERLARDLKLAARNSVSISERSDLLVHRRLETPTVVTWEPQLVLYHPNGDSLERRLLRRPSGVSSPFRLESSADWEAPLASPSEETRHLPFLSSFEAVLSERALVTVRLRLRSGEHTLLTERSVFLRQSGG